MFFFFFNGPEPSEIYTLSLHDALPICCGCRSSRPGRTPGPSTRARRCTGRAARSEEHTSELQSHHDLVCRLLLEKKKRDARCQHGQNFYCIAATSYETGG